MKIKILLLCALIVFLAASCCPETECTPCPQSGPAEVSQEEAQIPDELRQEIIENLLSLVRGYLRGRTNAEVAVPSFEVTGFAKLLPSDIADGIDRAVCYKVYVDYSYFSMGKKERTEIRHGIAYRTGDYWSEIYAYESTWKKHSCPGDYEGE